MNLVGFISTAVLSLTLVAVAPMYAQEQHEQEEQKAKPEEKKAQPEKSAKQEQKPAAQQEKNTKQEFQRLQPVFRQAGPGPHLGVAVVERRKAVHEFDVWVARGIEHGAGDLIGKQQGNPFAPCLGGLSHGQPDIGIDVVHSPDGIGNIFCHGDPGSGVDGQFLGRHLNGDIRLEAQSGAAIRTSIPSKAPVTSKERAVLLRASPM